VHPLAHQQHFRDLGFVENVLLQQCRLGATPAQHCPCISGIFEVVRLLLADEGAIGAIIETAPILALVITSAKSWVPVIKSA